MNQDTMGKTITAVEGKARHGGRETGPPCLKEFTWHRPREAQVLLKKDYKSEKTMEREAAEY